MPKLGQMVKKIRSKNAGPFWLTIDIFCDSPDQYVSIREKLSTNAIAQTFDTSAQVIKRYDIADLNVIKFSLPRPEVQGSIKDRDLHGASWAALLAEIEI